MFASTRTSKELSSIVIKVDKNPLRVSSPHCHIAQVSLNYLNHDFGFAFYVMLSLLLKHRRHSLPWIQKLPKHRITKIQKVTEERRKHSYTLNIFGHKSLHPCKIYLLCQVRLSTLYSLLCMCIHLIRMVLINCQLSKTCITKW